MTSFSLLDIPKIRIFSLFQSHDCVPCLVAGFKLILHQHTFRFPNKIPQTTTVSLMSGYLNRLFPPTMPPARTTSDGTGKKRALPFKAPRPVTSTTPASASEPRSNGAVASRTASAKTTVSSKKSATTEGTNFKQAKGTHPSKPKARQVVISDDEESNKDEVDEVPDRRRPRLLEEEDEDVDMDSDDSEEDAPVVTKATKKRATEPADIDEAPPIPPKLLTRLLYEGFEDKEVKIGKEAMLVVGKYIDTFVREALARAVFERNEQELEAGTGDGFLQVSHLPPVNYVREMLIYRLPGRGLGETCSAAFARFLNRDRVDYRAILPSHCSCMSVFEEVLENICTTLISIQGTQPYYSGAFDKSAICLPASFEVDEMIIPIFSAQYVPIRGPVAPIAQSAAPMSAHYRPEDSPAQPNTFTVAKERAPHEYDYPQRHADVGNRFRKSLSSSSRSYHELPYPVHADELEDVANSTYQSLQYYPRQDPIYADRFENVADDFYWNY
jgi:hypothetical protein